MTYRYLLDTNICSELLKNPQGNVARKLFQRGQHLVGINWVIEAELRYGARLKNLPTLTERVELLIHELNYIEQPAQLVFHYADIRTYLTQQGAVIGSNDLWIAAHARAMDICLVSHNQNEFSRIPGLILEDWL